VVLLRKEAREQARQAGRQAAQAGRQVLTLLQLHRRLNCGPHIPLPLPLPLQQLLLGLCIGLCPAPLLSRQLLPRRRQCRLLLGIQSHVGQRRPALAVHQQVRIAAHNLLLFWPQHLLLLLPTRLLLRLGRLLVGSS
jgi:hypothetical protein